MLVLMFRCGWRNNCVKALHKKSCGPLCLPLKVAVFLPKGYNISICVIPTSSSILIIFYSFLLQCNTSLAAVFFPLVEKSLMLRLTVDVCRAGSLWKLCGSNVQFLMRNRHSSGQHDGFTSMNRQESSDNWPKTHITIPKKLKTECPPSAVNLYNVEAT